MFRPPDQPARRTCTLLRHVVPNGLAPIVTDATILMGLAILTEAGLSFLGLGDQNAVSWGRMIFKGQRQLRLAHGCRSFPGLALLVLVASFNLLGDGLNQALNPQLRRLVARARSQPPQLHDSHGGGTAARRPDARGARTQYGLCCGWPEPSCGGRCVFRSAAWRQPRCSWRERLRQVEFGCCPAR